MCSNRIGVLPNKSLHRDHSRYIYAYIYMWLRNTSITQSSDFNIHDVILSYIRLIQCFDRYLMINKHDNSSIMLQPNFAQTNPLSEHD